MKVNHVDSSTALTFQWTCIASKYNNYGDKCRNINRNESSNIKESEIFPRNRYHHAACSLGKYVYICGGKDRYSPLKDLWRLDTVTEEWEQVENTKIRIPHLQGHTMLAHKSQLLIFGGTFSDASEDTPLWIYNTDLNHVHKFSCETYTSRPVGRREHSAVIYKASMYIYGGFLDSCGSIDEFWAFSIENEEWRMIRRHKPGQRHGHVAVVADSKMWMHGGMKGLMALSDLWTFSFGTNTWNKVRVVGVPPTLSNHTAHLVENSIILFGGSKNGDISQDIWIFRIDTVTWRHVSAQTGDLCPPITLHTSVLLSTSLVQNVNRDRTQSVPQLKGKSFLSTELKSVRPWTSPIVSSDNDELNIASSAGSHAVDILRLDNLRTDLDGNNNSSDEDINYRSETKRTEAETSFCSVNHIKASNNCSNEQLGAGNVTSIIPTGGAHHGYSNQLSLAVVQHSETGIVRSATAEHCGDVIPLLSRFHSVNSDVDFGENNLTLTLSDEKLFVPDTSEDNLGIQLNNQTVPADSGICSKYGNDSFGSKMASAYFSKLFPEKELSTREELLESLTMFRKKKEKTVLNFDLSHCKDSKKTEGIITENISTEMDLSKLNSRNVVTKYVTKLHDSEQENATFFYPFSRNIYEPCGKTLCVKGLCNDYQYFGDGKKHIQIQQKCISDLIIEDLEFSDMSEVFRNIKISCPSKPYLRSSSLRDLYSCINDSYDHDEENFGCYGLSKRHLTRSCGSLTSQQNDEFYEKKVKSQTYLIEKNTRNISSRIQSKNSFPHNEGNSGKYIKHVTSHTCRNASNLPRYRGNLYKLSNSEQISIATQTTGSQLSLPGLKQHQNADISCKFDHFVTGSTVNVGACKHEAAQFAQSQPEQTTPKSSIFMGTNICILVIGGYTESHSFQKEPLKIWRCSLN